jgi:hypothetical protein
VHAAATIVTLVAAGLFVRTVVYAADQACGFDTTHTLFVDMQVGARSATDANGADPAAAARAATERQLIVRLRSQGGVERVAVGNAPIGPDRDWELQFDRKLSVGGQQYSTRLGVSYIGADYLSALDVHLLAGRPLVDADITPDGSGATVITTTLSDTLWPGESPLGREFTLDSQRHRVVGLIPDIAYGSLASGYHGVIFVPDSIETIAVGTHLGLTIQAMNPALVLESIRRLARSTFPDAVRIDVATGRDVVDRNVARERLGAWFFSGFGLVALALGIGGVFGLVAYMAESRRRELGVRMALGADAGRLIRAAVVAGVTPVAIGVAIGWAGAAALARAATSLLIGVRALDPLSYLGAGGLMLVIAVGAGSLAASRIRRLAPVDALRAE